MQQLLPPVTATQLVRCGSGLHHALPLVVAPANKVVNNPILAPAH